jgi:hypothetical protein
LLLELLLFFLFTSESTLSEFADLWRYINLWCTLVGLFLLAAASRAPINLELELLEQLARFFS